MRSSMNNTEKMAALLRRLRQQMNGAVSEAMTARGIRYPLNYGVSVPTLRAVAAEFAPDHELARLLYKQQVRELVLAACYVADPLQVDAVQWDQWAAGIGSGEVAEHAAFMLAKSPAAPVMIPRWLERERPVWLRYCALLCLAHRIDAGVCPADTARELIAPMLQEEDVWIRRGLEAVEVRL